MTDELKPIEEEQPPVEDEAPKPSNSGSSFYKQKLATLEEQNKALLAKLEEKETATLQEKESFKELYEREKAKREEAEQKTVKLTKTVYDNFKLSAIKEEAIKGGILETAVEDLDIIDNSMVEVETTDQGRINIHGAKDFIEDLKAKKPHWFKKIGAPVVNNGTPGLVQTKELTPSEIVKLQKTDPAKYKEIMQKKYGIAN